MKREYMKPAMQVCELQQKYHILTGSRVSSVTSSDGEVDFDYIGGGSGPSRSRRYDGGDWEE